MDFLRDTKYIAKPEEIIEHHALAFYYSAIMFNWDRLYRSISSINASNISDEDLCYGKRVEIFTSCWEIIEYSENIREICKRSKRLSFVNDELKVTLEKCNELRRKKSHIPSRIKNIANSGMHTPLHGIVRWTIYNPVLGNKNTIDIPIISADPLPLSYNKLTKKAQISGFKMNVMTDIERAKVGADNICIFAYDVSLNISKLISDLKECSDNLKSLLENIYEKAASMNAIKMDAFRGHGAKMITVLVKANY